MGYETGPELESSGAGGLVSAAMAGDDVVTGVLLDLAWFDRAASGWASTRF